MRRFLKGIMLILGIVLVLFVVSNLVLPPTEADQVGTWIGMILATSLTVYIFWWVFTSPYGMCRCEHSAFHHGFRGCSGNAKACLKCSCPEFDPLPDDGWKGH